jgi:LuxR family maltose regulon positive regulatory protein
MLHPVATHTISAKITRPHYARVLPRTRLIDLLDNRHQPLVWVNGPPGAGKTALASSYLEAKNLPHLWYRLDEGDRDLPTFFHYLGLAMGHATGHKRRALPHLTAEYSGGAAFARLYFEELAARVQPPFVLVLDNYHEVPADA